MDPIEQVRAFAEATDLEGKWSSARQMMSSKAKPNGELFYSLLQQGFEGLGHIAEKGDDSDRLVATDLLVRMPASMKNNKRVQEIATDVRRRSLSLPLPPCRSSQKRNPCPEARNRRRFERMLQRHLKTLRVAGCCHMPLGLSGMKIVHSVVDWRWRAKSRHKNPQSIVGVNGCLKNQA
jgi:hypothetical protein